MSGVENNNVVLQDKDEFWVRVSTEQMNDDITGSGTSVRSTGDIHNDDADMLRQDGMVFDPNGMPNLGGVASAPSSIDQPIGSPPSNPNGQGVPPCSVPGTPKPPTTKPKPAPKAKATWVIPLDLHDAVGEANKWSMLIYKDAEECHSLARRLGNHEGTKFIT